MNNFYFYFLNTFFCSQGPVHRSRFLNNFIYNIWQVFRVCVTGYPRDSIYSSNRNLVWWQQQQESGAAINTWRGKMADWLDGRPHNYHQSIKWPQPAYINTDFQLYTFVADAQRLSGLVGA